MTLSLLDVIPRLRLLIRARYPRHLQHLHNPVEKPMDDLEPSRLVAPQRSSVADVACLALSRSVLEDDVGRLKDLNR